MLYAAWDQSHCLEPEADAGPAELCVLRFVFQSPRTVLGNLHFLAWSPRDGKYAYCCEWRLPDVSLFVGSGQLPTAACHSDDKGHCII